MTAFNEVMDVEREAEQAIALAKEQNLTAIRDAEIDRNTRLEAIKSELNAYEQEEFAKHKKMIESTVRKINNTTDAEVTAIRNRFSTQKNDLLTYIIEQLQ